MQNGAKFKYKVMNKYNVYINQKRWGNFDSEKDKECFQKEMQEQLKHFHPLNMSENNVEQYRKRYENSIVYVYFRGEKVTHLNKYN